MRILITGATGFIGRALVPRLQRDGHTVIVWARSPERARALLGADVDIVSSGAPFETLVATLEGCDAVVNLAGEPLMAGRWTPARRRAIEESRLQLTATLVRAIAAASPRPRVLVSGSAVGFYGDRGDERLTESSGGSDDFLARLCDAWERAASDAEAHGVRVVRLRIGVVLGREGGALARMLPPFALGIGGPIGSGRQFMPWIHLHDLVRVVAAALVDDRYAGAINGVAPEEATSRTFAKALGRALRRPAILPVPALALRILFGEAATVLLASQRVEPRTLRQIGFAFEFPTLAAALDDLVGGTPVDIAPAAAPPRDADAAQYVLRTVTRLDVPLPEAFAFFSKAENLGLITPAAMRFSILERPASMASGVRIKYRMRVGPVPITWRTRIERWEPERRFVDVQEAGPYRLWWHEHAFRADGARTVMEDRVYYAPPFGAIGRLANALVVAPALRRIFRYRGDVIRLRFGAAA